MEVLFPIPVRIGSQSSRQFIDAVLGSHQSAHHVIDFDAAAEVILFCLGMSQANIGSSKGCNIHHHVELSLSLHPPLPKEFQPEFSHSKPN